MTLFPTLCLYTTSKKESQMQISILSSILAQTVRETEATKTPVLRQTVFWEVTSCRRRSVPAKVGWVLFILVTASTARKLPALVYDI